MWYFFPALLVFPGSAQEVRFTHVVVDPDEASLGNTWAKSLADLDADGFLDILVATTGKGVFWYRHPDWEKRRILAPGVHGGDDMQPADLDGDGDPDIVFGRPLHWLENPGPALAAEQLPWDLHTIGDPGNNGASGCHDIEVVDLDLDGKPDVVGRSYFTTAYFQTGTPPRAESDWDFAILSPRPKEGTGIGDIDGDGDPDILLNGWWIENPLPGGDPRRDLWTEHHVTGGFPDKTGSTIADVNGDGKADLLLCAAENAGRFSWFSAPDPKGEWSEHIIDDNIKGFHTFKMGDADGDGSLDAYTAEIDWAGDPNEVSLYLNRDGRGLDWMQVILAGSGGHNLRVGDIGGDGDQDLFSVRAFGGPVEYWRNDLDPPAASIRMRARIRVPEILHYAALRAPYTRRNLLGARIHPRATPPGWMALVPLLQPSHSNPGLQGGVSGKGSGAQRHGIFVTNSGNGRPF